MMQAYVSAAKVSKVGNAPGECEDAFNVLPVVDRDFLVQDEAVIASVGDGASESLLSGHWARTLTYSLTARASTDPTVSMGGAGFVDAVQWASQNWDKWLSEYLRRREDSGNPIRWYEQPKLENGSHAAVLTAHFHGEGELAGQWYACGLGDVCLFHVRDGALLCGFPLASSEEFDNSPMLIGTKNIDPELLQRRISVACGSYQSGDQFFIGTDAFACWFLKLAEQSQSPWNSIRDLTASSELKKFESWADETRISGRMRNDDIAVVHVDMA